MPAPGTTGEHTTAMHTTNSPFDPVTIGPSPCATVLSESRGQQGDVSGGGGRRRRCSKHHRDLASGGVGMTTIAYLAVAPEGRTLPNQIWMRPDILPDLQAVTATRCTTPAPPSLRKSPTAAPSSPG